MGKNQNEKIPWKMENLSFSKLMRNVLVAEIKIEVLVRFLSFTIVGESRHMQH